MGIVKGILFLVNKKRDMRSLSTTGFKHTFNHVKEMLPDAHIETE